MIRVNLTVRTPGDDDSLADLYNDTWICLRGSTLSHSAGIAWHKRPLGRNLSAYCPRATHWIVPILRPVKCEALSFQPAGRYLYTFSGIVRNRNCHSNPLFDPYWEVDSRGSVLFSYISVWQLSF